MIPKQLYIDSFNFVPFDKEDKLEKALCNYYNTMVYLIEFNTMRGNKEIHFLFQSVEYSLYDFHNNVFTINEDFWGKFWHNPYNLDGIKARCQEYLEKHFKIKIWTVLL